MKPSVILGGLLGAMVVAGTAVSEAEVYKPVPGAFGISEWATTVTPESVLPEYPRPQMVRREWMSLNGLWDYSVLARDLDAPQSYPGRILVPFPIEAPLSGVGMMLNSMTDRTYANSRLWYRRALEIPAAWKDMRILLHFGAVDWEATVYLNGAQLGVHRGGYDAFSFDITDALKPEGPNELVLAVWDPTTTAQYPIGKQTTNPRGIFYTPGFSGVCPSRLVRGASAGSVPPALVPPAL